MTMNVQLRTGIAADAAAIHNLITANLNGDCFISDPDTPLGEHDRVLIVSSDAGG